MYRALDGDWGPLISPLHMPLNNPCRNELESGYRLLKYYLQLVTAHMTPNIKIFIDQQ